MGARVKICGITNREDARAAVAAGAELLGFNTWKEGVRFVDLEAAAEWMAELPVQRVALLVNAPLEEALRVLALPVVEAVQLHGDADVTPAYVQAVVAAARARGKGVVRALRLRAAENLEVVAGWEGAVVLLDAHVPGAFGGTGVPLALELVQEFRRRFPGREFWLAGGLRPENVEAAVRATAPVVVDVSSGVESAPGRKSAAAMQAFIQAARAAGLERL